jgi:hypothetical protein
MCVWLYFFLFYVIGLKNQKRQKNEFDVLICIWSSILETNKIMLYFLWKCKNKFLHIFLNLIIDLLKP